MWEFVKTHWKKVTTAVLAIPIIAVLSFYNMLTRKAGEAADYSIYQLDQRAQDVQLAVGNLGVEVSYQNGVRVAADGLGIALMTAEDFQADPSKLKGTSAAEGDFPLVVFFNRSGFDATGIPAVVRRAKDGSLVYSDPVRALPPAISNIKAVTVGADGKFTVYGPKSPALLLSPEEWYPKYAGTEPPAKVPSPAELDKMSDEELKALGIERRVPEKELKANNGKVGVRGSIVEIFGPQRTRPVPATVLIYRGKIEPFVREKYDPKDKRLVTEAKSNAAGQFFVELAPGTYTLVVDHDGKLWGNLSIQGNMPKGGFWPTVEVKDAWVDYEFRLAN